MRQKRKAEKEDRLKLLQETDVAVEVKRGNKKCGHLQAFVENRRQEERGFEEERGEAKSTLDFSAEVFLIFDTARATQ